MERKKKGQQIKTEKIKQQEHERRQKICFIPFIRLHKLACSVPWEQKQQK